MLVSYFRKTTFLNNLFFFHLNWNHVRPKIPKIRIDIFNFSISKLKNRNSDRLELSHKLLLSALCFFVKVIYGNFLQSVLRKFDGLDRSASAPFTFFSPDFTNDTQNRAEQLAASISDKWIGTAVEQSKASELEAWCRRFFFMFLYGRIESF